MAKKPVSDTDELIILDDGDASLDRVLEEVGDSATYVAITRWDLDVKKWTYQGQIPIEDFSLERVKEDYGGGSFRGRIYGTKDDGSKGYLKHLSFDIDPRFKPRAVTPPPVLGVIPGTPPASVDLGEVKELLKTLITLQSRQTPDPFEVFVKAAELFRPASSPTPAAPPTIGFSEMFQIFKQGMEVGQAASGDSSLGYLPIIEKVGLPLVEVLKELPRKSPPIVTKANGASMTPPVPTTPEDYLKKYLPQLCGVAAKAKNPELYAAFVLDQLPESTHEFIADTAHRPDVIPYFASLFPDVKNHEPWFHAFVEAIRASFSTEEETPHVEPVSE